jgi:hypothetical protein
MLFLSLLSLLSLRAPFAASCSAIACSLMNRLIPISPWRICSFVVLVVVVGALPCVIPATCFKSFVMVHMTGNQAAFARTEVRGLPGRGREYGCSRTLGLVSYIP